MKNYYFNPNNYDLEFIVLANSAEEALNSVKNYLKTEGNSSEFYLDEFERWKDTTLENLPTEYSIEEFQIGEVILTERS